MKRIVAVWLLYISLIILVGIPIMGGYFNHFVISQNGYMPTAREGVRLEDGRKTYSGNPVQTIDETTRFSFLGDIIYTETHEGSVYYSIGDWLQWNKRWFFYTSVIVLIILWKLQAPLVRIT